MLNRAKVFHKSAPDTLSGCLTGTKCSCVSHQVGWKQAFCGLSLPEVRTKMRQVLPISAPWRQKDRLQSHTDFSTEVCGQFQQGHVDTSTEACGLFMPSEGVAFNKKTVTSALQSHFFPEIERKMCFSLDFPLLYRNFVGQRQHYIITIVNP